MKMCYECQHMRYDVLGNARCCFPKADRCPIISQYDKACRDFKRSENTKIKKETEK